MLRYAFKVLGSDDHAVTWKLTITSNNHDERLSSSSESSQNGHKKLADRETGTPTNYAENRERNKNLVNKHQENYDNENDKMEREAFKWFKRVGA